MVVFILTMPGVGSWNGKWTGEDNVYCRVKLDREVPKEVRDRDFYYDFKDGWVANVEVRHISNNEARKFKSISKGFCGYDWMINSIIKNGKIKTDKEN